MARARSRTRRIARGRQARRRADGARGPRRGVATVELAVCLPMLVLFVMGSIECCNMIFLKHALTTASYEGVRAAIRYDATNAQVDARCNAIFTSHRVAGASIETTPTDVSAAPRGQQVLVTVSAPSESNSILPPWFFGGMTLTYTSTMVKE
jgi:Flp pilus assembly protein TadG